MRGAVSQRCIEHRRRVGNRSGRVLSAEGKRIEIYDPKDAPKQF